MQKKFVWLVQKLVKPAATNAKSMIMNIASNVQKLVLLVQKFAVKWRHKLKLETERAAAAVLYS
ncbi:hypothetical protein BSK66_09755 [Paenibacillus odorifer]|uniref:Uncharacterized protein n=1 Tax=Paenibacillus odorifer TaxID=189426 RepID=A0A1R0WUN5_9BACL|nr:hypothetical protein PODO_27170 [Paenibacillus odorifer]OMD02406.1 hypothetical protein BJP49_26430 [Paenibacillus odorifer]OMD09683.1 hypothetical protein BJP50_29745 [Paenibacillus odorifer]OMD21746.1 hypothetical protein BJP51_31945 [Paenibacillus odorifer]OME21883.1 hypothetical protein BSK57_18840 [Paenibacillus odorifer]